jgi:hypothetical protein
MTPPVTPCRYPLALVLNLHRCLRKTRTARTAMGTTTTVRTARQYLLCVHAVVTQNPRSVSSMLTSYFLRIYSLFTPYSLRMSSAPGTPPSALRLPLILSPRRAAEDALLQARRCARS